ncbi:MAG: AraC family ligand binding domain-containing protein, partial [Clostridia bacterium]|nr:AraC family ligand binding domain-containing protein [Clostridia bacterium]
MNKPVLFTESKYVDKDSGCFMHFVDSRSENFVLHYHEYYEIFITTDDNIKHIVNNSEQILSDGSLVFIRPNDIHTFEKGNNSFHFINLTFDKETIKSLFAYLSIGFPSEELLNSKYPPTVKLTDEEKNLLVSQINSLNTFEWNDKNKLKLQMRIVIANIFSTYFGKTRYIKEENSYPKWLKKMCEEMINVENFSIGIEAMTRISQKSYEHISRCMRKYMHTTPTA